MNSVKGYGSRWTDDGRLLCGVHYWSMDGTLLWEIDPCPEAER